MLSFGTKEFFDHLKNTLNRDRQFRKLGKGIYNATELIYLRDMKIGVLQKTVDGEITEFRLVSRKEIGELENSSEIVYYVKDYDTLISMLKGEDSFVSLVIDGSLEFKGSIKKAMQIQAASDRMEVIVKNVCNQSILPTKIQFQKWASKEGYI